MAVLFLSCSAENQSFYSVPENLWPEQLGNHRAILNVQEPSEAVSLDILWRRHDRNPESKRFIIVHENGDTIKNIHRVQVDNERCRLVFGPLVKSGKYFFYYLPYEVQENYGFYGKDYLKRESKPAKAWLKTNDVSNEKFNMFPPATFIGFQSRTEFDSFYPMEVIALKSEKDSLLKIYDEDFLVFPEDRKLPIRMLDEIPQMWIKSGPSKHFSGEAQKNEYYTFQLGVYAGHKDLENVQVEFTPLISRGSEIPSESITCFNTGGIGPYGKPFTKQLDVDKGRVQPLWIGLDIGKDIPSGVYTGKFSVTAKNAAPQTVEVQIKITNEILADRGDSEAWRHSRLRWLNSTLGLDDKPAKPFKELSFLGDNTYGFTGKTMTMSENGFPGSFKVKEIEILNRPISFIVQTKNGTEKLSEPQNVKLLKNESGIMQGGWESYSDNIKIIGIGTIEADGFINYKLKLKALHAVEAKDIRLEIPFKKEVANLIMGMDLPGSAMPQKHKAKWNGPHDSFWIGNSQAGLWCELRGSDYHGPLLNLYHPEYPWSWFNGDKGGFRIETKGEEVKAIVYSGNRNLAKGEELEFEWSFLITPVKDLNQKDQFTNRYYHNGGDPYPKDDALESGVKIVNLHHANNYNPHINYPFVAVDSMRWFIDQMHKKNQKVKIYYTIRELTNYTTELWALRSLGDEILGYGRGGGYPWLREHLVSGYRPQWYQWFPDKSADASIVNAPGDSRWYNYYIEGLKWLVENADIDGLYLDDVSYDRRTVKRIRKVLDSTKPGCLIDLHSNTGFSKGPATQYTEFFPYMDKLWFGESFRYNEMTPENWLVEVSGIPFGHMGDMLQGGGNRWLGMLFGMTTRLPWSSDKVKADPRPVWKIWDEFGIADSEMKGFWEDDPMVTTNNKNVKVTTYINDNRILVSIGNFSNKAQKVNLLINSEKLGIDPTKIKLIAPSIKDFQPEKKWNTKEQITLEPKKGWLIYIQN